MSPFDNEYAKRDANVCGSGMIAEVQMTCRGRMPILGPPQLWAQAKGIPGGGRVSELTIRDVARPLDTMAFPFTYLVRLSASELLAGITSGLPIIRSQLRI
jgi:hypothetical protein